MLPVRPTTLSVPEDINTGTEVVLVIMKIFAAVPAPTGVVFAVIIFPAITGATVRIPPDSLSAILPNTIVLPVR